MSCGVRSGRSAAALATVAAAWSLVLIPLAFVVPAYEGESVSSGGAVVHTHATLVAVNGIWVVGLLCVPAALSLVAWLALRRRCSRGGRRATVVAWAAALAFVLLCLAGAASLGLAFLPAAALLVAAAATAPAAPVERL
jgi:hypothetical protein